MYHCCVTCPAIPVIQPTNEMNLLKCIEGLAFTNGILCSNSRQASGACPCAKGRAGGNVLSYKLCKRGYGLTTDPRLYFCCGRGCRSLAMNHGLMQTENSRILSLAYLRRWSGTASSMLIYYTEHDASPSATADRYF